MIIVSEQSKHPIQNPDDTNELVYSGSNLTYTSYNYTTGKVTVSDSNIPIYNEN